MSEQVHTIKTRVAAISIFASAGMAMAKFVVGIMIPAGAQASTTSSYTYVAAVALSSGFSASARGQTLASSRSLEARRHPF